MAKTKQKSIEEKKAPKRKAGTFTKKSAETNNQETVVIKEKKNNNEWLLAFLGFVLGATLIAFIGLSMSSLRDEGQSVDRILSVDSTSYNNHMTDGTGEPVGNEGEEGSGGNMDQGTDGVNTPSEDGTTSDAEDANDAADAGGEKDNDVSDETETAEEEQAAEKKIYGSWYLVDYNNEQFDIEDEDDDVTEIEFDNVCSKNRGVTTFCKNASGLRKTTAEGLGAKKCDGGGTCRIGNSCLLWNTETEDDGDVEVKTAIYTCA